MLGQPKDMVLETLRVHVVFYWVFWVCKEMLFCEQKEVARCGANLVLAIRIKAPKMVPETPAMVFE